MVSTRELIESETTLSPLSKDLIARTVDALSSCEEAVTACAAGMLAEKNVEELRAAISQDMDCADIAAATRRALIRRSGQDSMLLTALLEACLLACERSHGLCSQHASHHEHCKVCSQATGDTVEACREALRSLRG